jgi:hypothetical protein
MLGKVSKGTYKFEGLGLREWIWGQFRSHAVTARYPRNNGSIGVFKLLKV